MNPFDDDRYYQDSSDDADKNKELELREENPAVKDAWEQYQIILKLAME